MFVRPERSALLLIALFAAACMSPRPERPAPSGDGVEPRGGAFILSGPALDDGRGSLLSTMQGKVPNLQIQRYSNECPRISLRSHVTFQSVVEPHIYVDGTRATNTCILESLRAEDVNSVEVYPMGFTTRPGYGTSAHGLILVFMRSS